MHAGLQPRSVCTVLTATFPKRLASFLHFGKKPIFSGQEDGHDVVRGVRRGEDGRATCDKALNKRISEHRAGRNGLAERQVHEVTSQ